MTTPDRRIEPFPRIAFVVGPPRLATTLVGDRRLASGPADALRPECAALNEVLPEWRASDMRKAKSR